MPKRRRLNVDDILMTVSTLSAEERGRIRAVCSDLGAKDPNSQHNQVKSIHEEDEKFLLFYDIFTETLREVVGKKLPKQAGSLPSKLYQDLKSGWTVIDDLLKQVMPRIKLTSRTKFYRIAILTVIDYIHNIDNMPVAAKTVAEQLQNCPELLHKQFPGYLQAGLMSMVLHWGDPSTIPDEEEF